LASGAVINWVNGDVTITHASNTLTFAGAASGYQFAELLVPTANDGAPLGSTSLSWADLFLADGGVINWGAGGVTATHTAASDTLTLALDAGNLLASTALTVAVDGTAIVTFAGTALSPATNDVAALGTTALGWADVFLADGAVVNWGNGGVTITHTAASDSLTLALDAGNALGSTLFTIALDGASELVLSSAALYPASDDGLTLGIVATNEWADLFLALGAVIGWDNGDVTVTHAANALAFAGATSGYTFDALVTTTVAGNTARFVNSTDSASVQVVRLEGDRATMADNDEAYVSFMLSNDGGTQTEFARQTWIATDVNAATSVDAALAWAVAIAGTLTGKLRLEGSVLSPFATDATALGSTSLMWSDLFLASGAVLNWNNGDVTLTHSANLLAFAGATSGYTYDNLLISGHTASLAVGGTAHNLQVWGTSAATGGLSLGVASATAGTAAALDFYRSKNAAIGSATVVASADLLGAINWYGAQQTGTFATQTMAAQIRAEVDGTVTSGASGDMPGRIVFSTTADSGSAVTDRLILDAAGIFKPNANDGVALGTATLSYADLFLATGAVIGWANGDVTLTHASNTLTFAGAATGYSFDSVFLLASGFVINWNSGDVTLTHAANTLTMAGGNLTLSDTTVTVQMGTVTTGASTATPATLNMGSTYADTIVSTKGKLKLYDDGTTVFSIGVSATAMNFFVGAGATFTFLVGNVAEVQIDATALSPAANDGNALGTASLGWADLHLASGAVINFANSNLTLTHTSGVLTCSGQISTATLRINSGLGTVGTGVKTISNAADSSTNFGHYLTISISGTDYFVPCGATAPT
jgi:hypothetical protein